jgi:uncharacterized protein
MPYFVLRCTDSDQAPELRPVHRPAHLDHITGSGVVRIAGRMLDATGGIVGSLLIVETKDAEAVEAFSLADPFRRSGVYSAVEIVPYDMSFVDLPSGG